MLLRRIGSVLTGKGRTEGEVGMKETEKVPFDSMPQLIRGSFLTKEQLEKLKEPFKDVVSVVRCRDCIYWQDNNDGYPHIDCKWREDETPDPDDFCSAGERKVGR